MFKFTADVRETRDGRDGEVRVACDEGAVGTQTVTLEVAGN